MPSKKEIEAAAEALHYSQSDNGEKWPNDLADYERENLRIDARAALEAAARVRAEDNAGEPIAWRYRYTDPLSGKPVWRYDNHLWNGQRPFERQALFAHPAQQPSGPVQAHIEHTNGKRWRIESADGRWTIQPEGQITADEARVLCERILSALTAGEPAQVPSGWRWVPEKLTPEMRKEFMKRFSAPAHYADALWAAQLSAAPAAPTAGGGDD